MLLVFLLYIHSLLRFKRTAAKVAKIFHYRARCRLFPSRGRFWGSRAGKLSTRRIPGGRGRRGEEEGAALPAFGAWRGEGGGISDEEEQGAFSGGRGAVLVPTGARLGVMRSRMKRWRAPRKAGGVGTRQAGVGACVQGLCIGGNGGAGRWETVPGAPRKSWRASR